MLNNGFSLFIPNELELLSVNSRKPYRKWFYNFLQEEIKKKGVNTILKFVFQIN